MELYYILSTERIGRQQWWKPNEWGYTNSLSEAGKYTKAKAFELCRRSMGLDVPVPCDAMQPEVHEA